MKFGDFLFTMVFSVVITLTVVFYLVGHGKLCGRAADDHIVCVVTK